MNSPRRPDGPPVRDGKPYSAIAHLAEDVEAVRRAWRKALRAARLLGAGRSTPPSCDARLLSSRTSAPKAWSRAIRRRRSRSATRPRSTCWSRCTASSCPTAAGRAAGRVRAAALRHRRLSDRGRAAARLVSAAARRRGHRATRADFVALWREALQPALDAPPTWVLRDYHSPNLLWLPEREGIARVGLLDFQDARDGAGGLRRRLAAAGRARRRAGADGDRAARPLRRGAARADPDFDPAVSSGSTSRSAAQRATKILGIFARLDRRDGKPQYLRHMPRIWRYLHRSLAHPALAT